MKKFITLMIVALIATSFFAACTQNNSRVDDKGVVINGVKWATRNVDAEGTFADTPESTGMFYQWNRKKAWAATDRVVSDWDSSTPTGDIWEKANDPSPKGWRVPTSSEIKKLFDKSKVSNVWTTQNGVKGQLFIDLQNGNELFLPAAGYRYNSDGALHHAGTYGHYWSSTQYNSSGNAYYVDFDSGNALAYSYFRRSGFCVRPVAE
jgi:uncharacterized protein (TIGR02145 family)